jgi:hypothetical protein
MTSVRYGPAFFGFVRLVVGAIRLDLLRSLITSSALPPPLGCMEILLHAAIFIPSGPFLLASSALGALRWERCWGCSCLSPPDRKTLPHLVRGRLSLSHFVRPRTEFGGGRKIRVVARRFCIGSFSALGGFADGSR